MAISFSNLDRWLDFFDDFFFRSFDAFFDFFFAFFSRFESENKKQTRFLRAYFSFLRATSDRIRFSCRRLSAVVRFFQTARFFRIFSTFRHLSSKQKKTLFNKMNFFNRREENKQKLANFTRNFFPETKNFFYLRFTQPLFTKSQWTIFCLFDNLKVCIFCVHIF